jgi:hypothetical protein
MRDDKGNLGTKLEYFPIRKRKGKRWIALIAGVLLILISIGLLIYFSLTGWTAIVNHGRAVMVKFLPFVLPLLFIVFPLGIILIIFSRLHWWDAVTAYENGISIKKGFRSTNIFWADVEQFDTRVTNIQFAGSPVNTRIKLILKPRNKRSVIIKNKYRRMSELIHMIRVKTLPILAKHAHDQMEKGQEIRFHNQLIATINGLKVNDNSINWTDFEKPKVKNGVLSLKDKNGEIDVFRSNINRVKNLDLLLTLIANPPSISSSTSSG